VGTALHAFAHPTFCALR